MSNPLNLDAEAKPELRLLPYPRMVTLKGAPLRLPPSSYLYLSEMATSSTRRRGHQFCQNMQQLGYRVTINSAAGLSPTQALLTPSGSFPKFANTERALRGEAAGPEGYRLTVTAEGALLHGADEQGMHYAGVTFCQLAEDSSNLPGLEIEDHPLTPLRAIHLDFKGWPPTPQYLKWTLALLGSIKINAVVLEYESFFDFPSQPGLAAPGALNSDQMAEIDLFAQDLGITLIPLVPCLGNAGYVLRKPAYADLREHPDYWQQYCPANPATLEVVSAMMEDLIAVHRGKYFHAGGDELRLLGSNPASEKRAKQLGGRAALYLEYIGKICRYLLTRERTPLVWDDMFRKMSDEQVKWLPPEVTLTSWQYEGHGGRAAPAILTNLDRYRKLGRSVWGAATRLPATRYESFDNIDAWAEAAELGYVSGMITTSWTREHNLGGLYAPPETAWPGALYAAERMWGCRKGPSREEFPQTFLARFFGVKDHALRARLWAGLDLMQREHPRRAYDYLATLPRMPRNNETLAFLNLWNSLGALREYVQQFDETCCANYANLQAGQGDPFHCGRLHWRVADLKSRIPALARAFSESARRLTHESAVQEYLDSNVAYHLKRLDDLESLLGSYPAPGPEWRQPTHL